MRKPSKWTEAQMWGGLKLIAEPIGAGFTMRRLEAVAPGWPDVVASTRVGQQACLVELKVLPSSAAHILNVNLPQVRTWEARAEHVGARWKIPFRDAQPGFLRGWAADGGRAVVLCDVHPEEGASQVFTLGYVARAEPAWYHAIQGTAPRPDFMLVRASKYLWSCPAVRVHLFPV